MMSEVVDQSVDPLSQQIKSLSSFVPSTFLSSQPTSPPKFLYHYTGQDGLLGIIEGRELWATKIQYMNDAAEYNVGLKIARDVLQELLKREQGQEKLEVVNYILRHLDNIQTINIFVASFCEEGDLLNQWRGYSGDNYGFSIGFAADKLEQVGKQYGFRLSKCIYDSYIQRKIIEESVEYAIHTDNQNLFSTPRLVLQPITNTLFWCSSFFKDAAFEHEREWRLVRFAIGEFNRVGFRSGKSMVVPFYKLPLTLEEGGAIDHLIVGPCPHMDLSVSSIRMLLINRQIRRYVNSPNEAPDVRKSAVPYRNW